MSSRLIRSGTLAPGEELPSVRAMAVGLAIHPDTVEEAFAKLEKTGFVTRSEGTGVLVAPRDTWSDQQPSELESLWRFSEASVVQRLFNRRSAANAECPS